MNKLVEVAERAVANYLTVGWDGIHKNKAHWRETYGMLDGIYGDVNGPFQDDCREAAKAAILAFLEAALEDEGVIEAVARALCQSEEVPPDEVYVTWEDGRMLQWETYQDAARAALRALIQQVKSAAPGSELEGE
jgi:hypothetical protein